MATDVKVPTLGESITEATVGQWLKKPGETVAADEPIASLETDKVSVEVNAPVAGTLAEQLVAEGDTVAVGAVIARIGEGGASVAPAQAAEPAQAEAPAAAEAAAPAPKADEPVSSAPHDSALTLSPAVRRAVLEHHLDPSKIHGTGKDGRITKDDVLAAASAKESGTPAPQAKAPEQAQAAPVSQPSPAPTRTGERTEERVKMTRLRQTIATRLKEAQETAALLTTFNDVDISEVIAARTRY